MSLRFDDLPADLRAPGRSTRLDVRPNDLLAPRPPGASLSVLLDAITFRKDAVAPTPTLVPFRLPLPPDVLPISALQTQVRIVDHLTGDEVAARIDALRGDDQQIVPHHRSGLDATGGIVAADASPLMLTGAFYAPLDFAERRQYRLEINNGRTVRSGLPASIPDFTYARQGPVFRASSDDTKIELAEAIVHVPFFVPESGETVIVVGPTLPTPPEDVRTFSTIGEEEKTFSLILTWNRRERELRFDNTYDREFSPGLPTYEYEEGDYERIAVCRVRVPADTSWEWGVGALTDANIEIVSPNTSASENARSWGDNTKLYTDAAHTLIETIALPADGTASERAESAAYLCSTQFLSDVTTVPLEVRSTWPTAEQQPDRAWDSKDLGERSFGRTEFARFLTSIASEDAAYNVGVVYAERWMATGRSYWWHYVIQACVGLDRYYWDADGDGIGNAVGEVALLNGWQYAVAYALTEISRFKTVFRDLAAYLYRDFSAERRWDAFTINTLAAGAWLRLDVPTDKPQFAGGTTRLPTTFPETWAQALKSAIDLLLNKIDEYGRLPQADYIGLQHAQSTAYTLDAVATTPSPKPYHTEMCLDSCELARILAMPSWSSADRSGYSARIRAKSALALDWMMANAYLGSPIGGTQNAPGDYEDMTYITETYVCKWSPETTPAVRAAAYASGSTKYAFNATTGLFEVTIDPATSDAFTTELPDGHGWAALSGFRLRYLTRLIHTETDATKLLFYRRLFQRTWNNKTGYMTAIGEYTSFTFSGTHHYVSYHGPAKFYGEVWSDLHTGSALMADILTNGA